ncbi:hypothetical protein HHI36_020540 [Cryptolaemus montrouzieri]|uniref:Solute carrier family 46 member 3 n=1 Tax=Cryptolaemus montrouzieri TaxID=559131 RepID=A0ABD2NAK6_9CUCU
MDSIESEGVKTSRTKSFLLTLTVEPLVLFYIIPSTMNQLITQNLFLEKSCRFTLAYNDSVCSAMSRKESSGYSDIQEYKVHQEVSEMMFVKSFVHGIIPLVLMFFAGSWSDENSKRKPCILGPIIGELIAIICLIMNVVFLNQMPILLTSLAYTLPMAMSGGWPCLFLGLYSYVTTSTSAETLTMKIGSVVTTHNIAMIVGIGLAGILLNLLGFIGAYGATFFMILSSLVYGYYIIKDRKLIIPDIEDEIHNLEKTPKN